MYNRKVLSLICLAGIIGLLAACAVIPKPNSATDSLVIGHFILDFPDGYFQRPPMTARDLISLKFIDMKTGARSSVVTTDGWFKFICNGDAELVLDGYEYKLEIGYDVYTIRQGGLQLKMPPSAPHKLIYPGHIVLTFSKPEASSIEDNTTHYAYRTSWQVSSKKDEVLSYIQKKDPESPWLQAEIVEN